jgi:cysteinyl-tRNA synthetase
VDFDGILYNLGRYLPKGQQRFYKYGIDIGKVFKMILYNTLGQKKEEFIPHTEGKVNMYTCGPTVYHYAHIGNLRTYIMEDVLEKYLRYSGYDVTRVMNITDVGHLTSDADTGDDKMVEGAKREHKSVMEIAKFYTDAFFDDCKKLNIKTPDVVEPATNCIDEFIKMIETLMDKGYAYFAGGNVYFDTSKLDDYYVFGNMNADDLEVGVREDVDNDENKRNKTDFVLWFTKSKFEDQALKWDSPWGVGYPGWHIECSSISIKHLGEYLDIHCGGVDNAFPHHTNEIAQSEAFLGHKWCNYWFHVLHLNDNTGKMSKSKGEFLTVSLLEEKGYNPLVYRMFCLQSHYRKPLTFSYDSLDNTAKAYDKLVKRIGSLNGDGEIDKAKADELDKKFKEALDNDLNTSLGLTAVYDVLKADTNDATKLYLIEKFDEVLGLDLTKSTAESDNNLDAEIESLIAKRQEARANKDWATADKIRDDLLARNIKLIDTPEGVKWEQI